MGSQRAWTLVYDSIVRLARSVIIYSLSRRVLYYRTCTIKKLTL